MPQVAYRLVLIRTYVRCKFGGVATARERVARERQRVGESLTIIINDDDSSRVSAARLGQLGLRESLRSLCRGLFLGMRVFAWHPD